MMIYVLYKTLYCIHYIYTIFCVCVCVCVFLHEADPRFNQTCKRFIQEKLEEDRHERAEVQTSNLTFREVKGQRRKLGIVSDCREDLRNFQAGLSQGPPMPKLPFRKFYLLQEWACLCTLLRAALREHGLNANLIVNPAGQQMEIRVNPRPSAGSLKGDLSGSWCVNQKLCK